VSQVLVLNADWGPLHWVTIRHAVRMLVRQVAEVHEAEPDRLIGIFPLPRVVRLVAYVKTKWRHTRGPAWSRPGVLARDGYTCVYCGGCASTVDHVLPRSRNGGNTWSNTVAACGGCNQRKGDRTPAEAGMKLRIVPATPTWASLLRW
jgi:5-methylcytosine-specific restriction endonuclease McrA